MTRKLYWEEPYSKNFVAKVVSTEGQRVVLDQTLFYPRGGGVACDTGTINTSRVLETTKSAENIVHSLDSPATLQVGDEVRGLVDWERRHRLMRMHTAGHLLSSVLYSRANCRITGNQIDVDRSRMDFNLEAFDRGQIEGYVAEANELIRKDAPVKTYFLKREEALKLPDMVKLAEAAPPAEAQLRIVEIEGIDRQADGGLHVSHLREIGQIQLLKLENKGKTNRRLYYDLPNASD
ncbi:MAG TPA: alanyl-tRNA editing protein [Candidatus Bathyarchaeia archaeon]|jgi:Ser-tRNA(Ala) deacylase AlaX|nr:alanyl-tRNA editing protein [Candidatus Bathyarchaeia archaeon]